MIGADPEAFWAMMSARETHKNVVWSEEDVKQYKTPFFKPDCIHAVSRSSFTCQFQTFTIPQFLSASMSFVR